jgi:very-short-patch-repair endonuclease
MTEFYNRKDETLKRRELRTTMPKAEVVLWSKLKGRQLLGCKFRRQYGVGPYVIDFYSPEIKLGIELDGDSHFAEGKREYDQRRQVFVESFGIRIVRFLNVDVYDNLEGVLEAIVREVLERRAETKTPVGRGHSQPPLTTLRKGGIKTGRPPSIPPLRRGGQGGSRAS